MTIHLAHKTLSAIDAAIAADQGAAFRGWLEKTMPMTKDAYSTDSDGRRSHLGASVIGGKCAREIWYKYRWAKMPKFEGRMLRLFNRGHLEEGRMIAMILAIGCQVYQHDANGKQYRISHANGHFGGSGDGLVVGLPDLPPNTVALLEFKTHNNKSFEKLVEDGVKVAKSEHYVQIQIYLEKMGLDYCLYLAVNKDDDRLHGEIVFKDSATANIFLDRGEKIIASTAPPKKINESVGFWECKYCDQKSICHLNEEPAISCRTCQYATPIENAQWYCRAHSVPLNTEQQKQACQGYVRLF